MTEDLTLNMEAYLPLRDVVFHTLRDAILKGELKPGERLMEMHLADKLGVSRTPIREAIRMLEKEGLAVTIPRKGAQVACMTEKDLEDVLELRDALDELAVTAACERWNEADMTTLEETITKFEEAVKKKNVKEIVACDELFHDAIYKSAKNGKLENIINNLREQMYRYRYEYVKDNTDYTVLVDEHRKIIQGLKDRDKKFVRAIMHEHLENQIDAVRRIIMEQRKSKDM